MRINLIAFIAALAVSHVPAAADYANAPFRDLPFEVADTALDVLDGEEPVTVPRDNLPFVAAVAAFLLLSEKGLAEAYEEAVESGEDEDYAAAYDLLQTARPWLAAVPSDPQIQDLMARLDALMPGEERPQNLDADPEAAEVLAHELVAQLERVANADLYPGRDLARAIATVAQLTGQGCVDTGGNGPRKFQIAEFYYENDLEAPLSVMANDEAGQIEQGFEALLEGDHSACQTVDKALMAAKRRLFP